MSGRFILAAMLLAAASGAMAQTPGIPSPVTGSGNAAALPEPGTPRSDPVVGGRRRQPTQQDMSDRGANLTSTSQPGVEAGLNPTRPGSATQSAAPVAGETDQLYDDIMQRSAPRAPR